MTNKIKVPACKDGVPGIAKSEWMTVEDFKKFSNDGVHHFLDDGGNKAFHEILNSAHNAADQPKTCKVAK